MGVGKFQKENIKVLMEYRVFEINNKKMIIFVAQFLSENP
jgi:hypothetical protein